jgi:dCMP deaminase
MKNYSSLFMDIAERTAIESNCVKYKVGAVIVKDNRIILQGYNGTISGFLNCSEKFKGIDLSIEENRDLHHKWSSAFEIHATMYCTHTPCNNCLKHLIQAGVKTIVFKHDYIDNSKLSDREELLKLIEVQCYEAVSYACS